MNDQLKFLLQTLLAPIAIALTGFIINSNLQEKQRNFEKLKLTQEVFTTVFEKGNPHQILAMAQLLPQIIDDRAFADTSVKIIHAYYQKLVANALATGNDSAFVALKNAATTPNSKTNSVLDSIKTIPNGSRAQLALDYEQKGFEELNKRNFAQAKDYFEKANNAYPQFHSAYEIAETIRKETDTKNTPIDTPTAYKNIMDKIRTNYSWKVPQQYLK